MRFRTEQAVPGPRDAVVAAFVDPDYYAGLDGLPTVGRPEVLDHRRKGRTVLLEVRYLFTGQLAPAARRILDPAKLTWVNRIELDLDRGEATLEMLPDHYPNRLSCRGSFRFEAEGAGTREILEGDLIVHFLLVGRTVEKALVGGLGRHLAEEAPRLGAFATAAGSPKAAPDKRRAPAKKPARKP